MKENCIKVNCPAEKIGHPCDRCDVAVSTHEVIDTPESPVLVQTFEIVSDGDKEKIRREIKRQREREMEEFERYNATDSFGNCFSDADPGL